MADYVLTGYTGKALEKQLAKIDTNAAEIEELKKNSLTSIPEATQSSLGGVKISGSITSSNPSGGYGVVNMANGMIYVPLAKWDMSGTNTYGVISGEDWHKIQYAHERVIDIVGGGQTTPLKVEEDINRGYFIGLWQDGNTYKGGYIPPATADNMGLLSGEFQPYLVSLWKLYEDGDEMEEALNDMASNKELKELQKKVENIGGSIDLSSYAQKSMVEKMKRHIILPFSWLLEFGSTKPNIIGSSVHVSGEGKVYFSRNAKQFLVMQGMSTYYGAWDDGFDNTFDSGTYSKANYFMNTDENVLYRKTSDGSLVAVTASSEDIATIKAQILESLQPQMESMQETINKLTENTIITE